MRKIKQLLFITLLIVSSISCNNDSELKLKYEYVGTLRHEREINEFSFCVIENKIFFDNLCVENIDKINNDDNIKVQKGIDSMPLFYFNQEKYYFDSENNTLVKGDDDQRKLVGKFEVGNKSLFLGDILITSDSVFIVAEESGLTAPDLDGYQHRGSCSKIYKLDKEGGLQMVWQVYEFSYDYYNEINLIKYNKSQDTILYAFDLDNEYFSYKFNSNNDPVLLDHSFSYLNGSGKNLLDIYYNNNLILSFCNVAHAFETNVFEVWRFNGKDNGHELLLESDELYGADFIFEYKNDIYIINNVSENYEYSETKIYRLKKDFS